MRPAQNPPRQLSRQKQPRRHISVLSGRSDISNLDLFPLIYPVIALALIAMPLKWKRRQFAARAG